MPVGVAAIGLLAHAAPMRLGERTWTDLEGRAPVLAVPLGACEQHGPHLPLDTDTRIAVALAEGLAARRGDVVVGPAVAYGSSGEHQAHPGTLSLGPVVMEELVVELVRSAKHWARGVVLVAWHGGNSDALGQAVPRLRTEGRAVVWWEPRVPGGDAHAGRTETSLLLALAPEAVRAGAVAAGDVRPLAELLPALRARGCGPWPRTASSATPAARPPPRGTRCWRP